MLRDQILCVLKETLSETTVLLKEAFGKERYMIRQFGWHKAFVYRQKFAEFEPWGGVLQTVVTGTNINTIVTVIEEDWHLTIRALAKALHVPRVSICRVLT